MSHLQCIFQLIPVGSIVFRMTGLTYDPDIEGGIETLYLMVCQKLNNKLCFILFFAVLTDTSCKPVSNVVIFVNMVVIIKFGKTSSN